MHLPNAKDVYKIKRSEFDELGTLGHGSYGTVIKVRHKISQTVMAAKILKVAVSRTCAAVVKKDLSMLEAIDDSCQYIVKFYGVLLIKPDSYWIIMELCKSDLDKVLENALKKRQSPSELLMPEFIILHAAFCIANGMHFLKSRLNILHR